MGDKKVKIKTEIMGEVPWLIGSETMGNIKSNKHIENKIYLRNFENGNEL